MWQNHPKCGKLAHRKWTAFLCKALVLAFGTAGVHTALALPSPNSNVPVEVQQCGYVGCWQDNNVRSTPSQPLSQKPSLPDYVGYAWIGGSNQVYTTKSYFYNSRQEEELARLYIADTALNECIAKHGNCHKGGMLPLDAVTFGTHWLVLAGAGTDDVFFGNWQTKRQATKNAINKCQNHFWQNANKGIRPEACKVIQAVGIKRYSTNEQFRLLETWKQGHFSRP